jgi:putative nucleotidyltransferase with HDIG domain
LLLSNEARKSGLSKDSFSDKQRLFSKGARDYSKDKNQQLVAEELLNKFLFMFIPERKIYYKDQIIIREGDLVTSDILRVLREAGAMEERRSRGFKAIGVALFVCVGMMAILVYLYQFNKLIYESVSQLTLIGIIILVILIFAKIIVLFTRADIEFNNTPLFSPFIIPIATAGMLVSVLLDSKIAISINIVVSLLAALMLQDALPFLLVTLISGTMGIYAVTRASKRADFVKAGMHISMTNLALILALYLMKPAGIHGIASKVFARDMIWGFANGILCAILGVGTLPFIEIFFRTTTSLSLMELADLNHPLMQRLLKSAPGTFHHSVNVGNLGEAAAKQIGADPLLCKAGGYYHDIGKLKRPGFFIENQLSGENVHDTLTPNLSCLIITSHVRDGIELGKEYKFTNVISNIIAEHHGTTQVSYFYNRAVEEAGPDRKEEIKDFHFRYPGPKPQSKESAIVMLADSIESVCRTLNKPTAASLKNMVKKICNDKFMDGQLDESNLTLKDLEIVEDAFVKILAGRFHTRITYPDSNDSRKGSDDFKVSESKEVKEPKEPKESKEVKKVSDLSKAPRTGNE